MLKVVVLVTGLSLVARSYAQDSGEKSRQIDWTEILMGRHVSIGTSAVTGNPTGSASDRERHTDKSASENKRPVAPTRSGSSAIIGLSATTDDISPSADNYRKQADVAAEEWKRSVAPPKIGSSAITGDPAPSAGISKKQADKPAGERKESSAPAKIGSSAVTGDLTPSAGDKKKQADQSAEERKESSAPFQIGSSAITMELTPSAGDKKKQADKSVRDWIVHDNKKQADKSAGFLSKYMYQWQQSDIAKAHTKIAEKLESYSSMPIGVCLIFLTLLTCVAVAGLRARRWFQAPGISSSIEVVQTGCPSAKSSTSTKV